MILCVARMEEHTATPARLGSIMWAARESALAHKACHVYIRGKHTKMARECPVAMAVIQESAEMGSLVDVQKSFAFKMEESVLRSTTLFVERMEQHMATPVRLGKEMLSAQGNALANQEESVLRSMTLFVERMEEHMATPVRLEKEMLSAQGSALVNQVLARSALKSTLLCVGRMGRPTATPVRLEREM